ncbi:heterokaryon incompatibility protein-domain-containing protein, partial [Tricladium varicosporioides]
MTDLSPIRTIPNNYTHYSPLDSTRKEIRLLHILPADSDDGPLVVALVRTTLADCPEYRALSYCWGNLEDTKTVRTAHANFEITSNLYAALKSFRRSWEGIDFLWADMLCINQGDVEERSGQVGIMKSIYTIANSVSVWLGDDEE